MTRRTRNFVIAALTVLAVGIGTGLVAYYIGLPTRGLTGQAASDDLRYVPKDATLVAYVDVHEAVISELRQRLRREPPPGNERPGGFTNRMGIDVERDVNRFVAYAVPGSGPGDRTSHTGLILARGIFDEAKIEALMREHGARVEDYKGSRLIIAARPVSTAGASDVPPDAPDTVEPVGGADLAGVSLAFVEPGLAAFGSTELVRRTIDMKGGESENIAANEEMVDLLRTVESSTFWAAGRLDVLSTGVQLPPLASRFTQQLTAISTFVLSGHIDSGVDVSLRAEARSGQSAAEVRQAIQGLLALGKLSGGSRPGLRSLIDSIQLTGSGTTLSLSLRIPPELFDDLGTALPNIPPDYR